MAKAEALADVIVVSDTRPKGRSQQGDDALAVIEKIHKRGTAPDPLHGRFEAMIRGKPAVVEYEPNPELRDSEQVPLMEDGGIDASRSARCCLMPLTLGTRPRASRSAMKTPLPATFISRSRCARLKRSARTF